MFVVKRPFKNIGKVHTVGSVITEPAKIKRFKGKIAEGKIIEVTEQTYDYNAKYFKDKYGVDLPPIASTESNEEVKDETDIEVSEEIKEATQSEESKSVAKPAKASVAKAKAK